MKPAVWKIHNNSNSGLSPVTVKILLWCGILSSAFYIATDLVASFLWKEYSYSNQTISELFAIDAPTQALVVVCFTIYACLIYAFGIGLFSCAKGNKPLRLAAVLIIGKEIIGLVGTLFFPIHQRGEEGNYSDIGHGVITAVGVFLFMLPAMIAGAVAFKGIFRYYSIVTMILFVIFGIWAGTYQPAYTANLPTPMMGIWERVNIYGYMLWIVVFSLKLMKGTSMEK